MTMSSCIPTVIRYFFMVMHEAKSLLLAIAKFYQKKTILARHFAPSLTGRAFQKIINNCSISHFIYIDLASLTQPCFLFLCAGLSIPCFEATYCLINPPVSRKDLVGKPARHTCPCLQRWWLLLCQRCLPNF